MKYACSVQGRFTLALCVVIAMAAARPAAQAQFTFFISVSGPGGEPVSDLRREELTVAEDGRPATIVRMVPVTKPVRVTILLDNGFDTGSLLQQYRNGVKALFSALPTGVEASLLTLAPQPRWVVRPTNDRVQLMNAADRITPDSAAPRMVDGLIEAANRIEQENQKDLAYWPIIVVVSTTGPEGSNPRDRDIERMVKQLLGFPTRVHVIMLGTGAQSPTEILGARQVQVGKFVVDNTGGRYEAIAAPTRISSLLEEFGKMIAEAHAFQHQQFLIQAERPAGVTGPLGRLAISLSRSGLTMTATAQGLKP